MGEATEGQRAWPAPRSAEAPSFITVKLQSELWESERLPGLLVFKWLSLHVSGSPANS